MATSTATNSGSWATGGFVSGTATTAIFTWNFPHTVPAATFNLLTGYNAVAVFGAKNTRYNIRCAGCGRWAKLVDQHTVNCGRCLGEMEKW